MLRFGVNKIETATFAALTCEILGMTLAGTQEFSRRKVS
jgi:hypothetical protein